MLLIAFAQCARGALELMLTKLSIFIFFFLVIQRQDTKVSRQSAFYWPSNCLWTDKKLHISILKLQKCLC